MTARALWVAVAGTVAFAAPVRAQTYLLVITGLGGEPAYEQRFHDLAATLVETARDRWGLAPEHTFRAVHQEHADWRAILRLIPDLRDVD